MTTDRMGLRCSEGGGPTRLPPFRWSPRPGGGWRRPVLALGLLALLAGPALGAEAAAVPESAEQIRLSFAPVVRQVAPAVVNVYTRRVVKERATSPFFRDPFFRRFFGDMFPERKDRKGKRPRSRQSPLGSGVIVSEDGLVITNHHVIKTADEITVVLHDRREYPAELIRTDERTDLAVLRIDTGGDPLPSIPLGDSDKLEVGDLVLAIGNPFGVGQTVTSGIVSALARTTLGVTDFNFFIQTDAAINPGNSGGALVTMDGRLAGINTAIYSKSGGSVGIGFAIPSNMVRTVLDSVRSGGKLVRPWLGAAGQTITADIAASLGMSRPIGVLINQIYPGAAADKAGLKVGDIILAVDDKEVEDGEALRFRIATKPIGRTAELRIRRRGEEMTLEVELAPPPENPQRNQKRVAGRSPLAGAVVANLSPAVAEEMSFDSFAKGVVVVNVVRRSSASRLGLKRGDVIARINDVEIDSVATLGEVLASAPRRWRLSIRRGGRLLNVVVSG